MRTARLLILEGNTAEARRSMREASGVTPSEGYAAVLQALAAGLTVDVCTPADAGAVLPAPLDSYDGLVITGSTLTLWKREPESLRQVDLVRAAYAAGLPVFGSCWGLQLGTVAAGGEVARNPRGRELGFARRIALTEAGRAHPLHAGREAVFDAPAMHGDEVVRLPEGATVTATNAMSAVQAVEIGVGRSTFWGVQFHPEFGFRDVAVILRGYGQSMVDDGFVANLDELDRYTADLAALEGDADRRDLAWRYGIGAELLVAARRRREIGNWLTHQVGLPSETMRTAP